MSKNSVNNFLYRMLCGFFLGISVIAPGVSGSVMAVMMGIYDELITIISNPFKNFKKNFFHLVPMGLGAVLSVAIFIQLLEWLFANYRIPAFLLFMGLIAGSLPAVYREANKGVIKGKYFWGAILALSFAVFIGLLKRYEITIGGGENVIYFSLCGLVAGMTGMIPGMSVSMMLMMLGVYQPMLEATARFEVLTMLPVAICFGTGMILFSKLTKYIFDKFRSLGYIMVLGFMLGSLVSIFPGLPNGLFQWLFSIVMIAAGLAISSLFQVLGKKFNTD